MPSPLAALLAAIQAIAAPTPPAPDPSPPAPVQARPSGQTPPGSDVIVTASRDPETEVKQFVDALMPGSSNGQVSRFAAPVCPMAWGMAAAQNTAVAARLRQVAAAAGLDVDKARCDPNVLVLVTHDRVAFIKALVRRYPYWFYDPQPAPPLAIAKTPDRAVVWHVAGTPLARGVPVPTLGGGGTDFGVNYTTQPATRIGFPTRPQFAAAIMVVEARELVGFTTTQFADYAAMRTLMTGRPDKMKGTIPTILGLLDTPMGAESPLGMTRWDFSALRAFYASDPEGRTATQRATMRDAVRGADAGVD